MKHLVKKLGWLLLTGIAAIALVVFLTNYWVEYRTASRLYTKLDLVPANKVGLVLGTAKKLGAHRPNRYYTYRIQAAVDLYQAGRVQYLLLSGDNSTKYYNEPQQMRQDLIKAGIPPARIYLDYAGFRTLDSIVRSKEIFGQHKITVISQPFHNQRAVYLALAKDIDAVGYNAEAVEGKAGIQVQIREYFARVKMMLDLLVGKDPKFLGEPIAIGSRAEA